MAYVGNPIDTQNTFQSLVGKRFNGDGSTTAFTLDVAPSSTLDIEVFVGNVRQDPNSAYTLSGTTLTFTGAPPSGTNNIYVVHQAKSVGTIGIPDDTISARTLVTLDNSNDHVLIEDATDGELKKALIPAASFAGIDDQSSSNDDQVTITDTAVVINEDSDDVDFRVESNGNANMLFVSGGNDVVGIGAEGDLGNGLHVKSADSGASVANEADELVVEASGDSGISILSGTGNTGGINFGDSGDNDIGRLVYDQSGNSMRFVINASERMRIISTGNLCFAKSSDSFGTAGHILYGETGSVGGTQFTSQSGVVSLSLNRLNDGEVLGFFSESSKEGNVSISGSTTSYNTFCGTHWSRLADNSKPSILRGTVMESIGTMMTWYQAVAEVAESTDEDGNVTPAHQVKESISLPNGKSVGDAVTFTSQGKEYTGKYVKEDNEQLPMCKISDTEESKGVYGVFMTWDDTDNGLDGDVNDMYVAALGAFVVRIHKDETVAIGDYLQSKGDGTAKKQADDILRASTIAKVTSTEKTHEYADGSYCVPCTLHCG
jgi:hypothetical protein